MADKGLIAAAGTLAKSQMPVDIAGEFMKTFMPAVEKAEKEKQAVQNEVAGFMANLKSDIDFTSLTPEMEKEVRRYLMESRNEYNELANMVARIDNHSSEEYQNGINRMSEIQREFATLAGELTTYNQEKINTADMFQTGAYSSGYAMSNPKEFALHKNIYGLSKQGMSPVSIKNGHLFFGTEDGEIRYSNIKAIPGKATAAIETVLSGAARASRSKVALTQEEINQQTYILNEAFQDPDVFASVLFDAPKDTLPLLQVKEEYIKAVNNGTLDKVMPQLINDAVGAIVNGYQTTAAQSAQAYQDSLDTAPNGDPTGPFTNLSADAQVTLGYYKDKKPTFFLTGGNMAMGYDKKMQPVLMLNGKPNPNFDGTVSQYVVGKYENGEFVQTPGYSVIPVGQSAEFVRITGLK